MASKHGQYHVIKEPQLDAAVQAYCDRKGLKPARAIAEMMVDFLQRTGDLSKDYELPSHGGVRNTK
jgi:hypothetical protein